LPHKRLNLIVNHRIDYPFSSFSHSTFNTHLPSHSERDLRGEEINVVGELKGRGVDLLGPTKRSERKKEGKRVEEQGRRRKRKNEPNRCYFRLEGFDLGALALSLLVLFHWKRRGMR
jgi:hypothetical protein